MECIFYYYWKGVQTSFSFSQLLRRASLWTLSKCKADFFFGLCGQQEKRASCMDAGVARYLRAREDTISWAPKCADHHCRGDLPAWFKEGLQPVQFVLLGCCQHHQSSLNSLPVLLEVCYHCEGQVPPRRDILNQWLCQLSERDLQSTQLHGISGAMLEIPHYLAALSKSVDKPTVIE